MHRFQWIFVLLAGAGLFLIGCGQEEEAPSPELQGIISSWDGGHLTVGDCLHTFRELYSLDSVNPQELEKFVAQVGHEWSSEKILYRRAIDQQLDRDPVYLDRIRPLREEYSMNLLIRREVDEPIRLTEKEVCRYYREHEDEFMVPGSYSYYRIFFSNEKHGPEVAQERAKECWRKLERGGNFSALLDEYTDTRPEKKNQLWGPFRPGERPAEIEQVILETPEETHSPVVETPPSGYMIFYPERKQETELKPFDTSKREAYQKLFKRTREERLEVFLEELAASYRVTPHPELFDQDDVSNEAILLEIDPGNTRVSWGEFTQYAGLRGANSRAERLELFEHYAKRKLLLNHVHEVNFTDTSYFKDRFRPVERRVLSDYFMELEIDVEVDPTEDEVYAFYEENPDAFRRPSMVEAWHITKAIAYPMQASEQDKVNAEAEAYNQLLSIRSMVAEQGHSFLTWAHRFSDNPDGGYLGFVALLDMPPEWTAVVARLEEGEISQPFRVDDSFEMVLRGKLEESGVLKYELAQEKAYELCRKTQIAKARADRIEEILTNANYEYRYQPLADLILRLFKLDNEPPKYYLDPYKFS